MLIKAKVITDSKSDKIVKKSNDHFEISVKDPKERGLANKKVLELVKKYFKGYNKIRIVSGHHSPSKIISLEK